LISGSDSRHVFSEEAIFFFQDGDAQE